MYRVNGQLEFSPLDLTRHMESPFGSWMERFALQFPEQSPQRDDADPLLKALAEKGYSHEESLHSNFIAQGLSVVTINEGPKEQRYLDTLTAIRSWAEVIV